MPRKRMTSDEAAYNYAKRRDDRVAARKAIYSAEQDYHQRTRQAEIDEYDREMARQWAVVERHTHELLANRLAREAQAQTQGA